MEKANTFQGFIKIIIHAMEEQQSDLSKQLTTECLPCGSGPKTDPYDTPTITFFYFED